MAIPEAFASDACAALDRIDIGVVLLDGTGVPCFVNRYAADLVRANDGLSIGREGLRGASRADTERLRRLLAEASASDPTGLCVVRAAAPLSPPAGGPARALGSGIRAAPGIPGSRSSSATPIAMRPSTRR